MRRTATVLVLATGLLASACATTVDGTATAAGSSSGGTSSSGSSSPSSGASPTTSTGSGSSDPVDYSAVLLGASDFPAGYEVQPSDPSALAAFTDGLSSIASDLTITPPECANTIPYRDTTGLALVTAVEKTTASSLAEVVGSADEGTLDTLRSTLQGCSTIDISFAAPDGSTVTGRSTTAEVSEPDVGADSALAYTTTSTVDLGTGTPFTTTQQLVYAQVGSTLVGISSTSLSGGPGADPATVSALLATAVEKVRAG